MSQLAEMWSKETKSIFNGVLLYSIAGMLYSIFDPIESMSSTAEAFGASSGGGFLTIVCYILLAGIIIGYFLFLQGLTGFAKILEPSDGIAVGKIRTGVILGLIATVFDFIPFLGWVGTILNIIAFILMLVGYSALKNSTTFPEKARTGASRLFISMILLIVGAVIGFIPLVGGFIEMVLDIVAFILMLTGWASIKNTEPTAA